MCKKLLLLTSIVLVLAMAGASTAGLEDDPNLVGWWKFDGDTSDSSGNGRDGTLVGEALLVDDGILGGALSLDGDGDYVTIAGYKGINADRTDPGNPFQKPFTVTCWIKTTGNGSLVNWGSSDGTGVGGQYQNFRIDGGRLRAEHGNGRFRGAAIVNDDEWRHVAMAVAEASDMNPPGTQLYVDGVMDTEGADTVNAQNIWNLTEDADVGIGVRSSHIDRFLLGMIDDVRIYDRQLANDEIRIMIGLLEAYQPVPADGAVDTDPGSLEWTAGPTAVSHKVYLSKDETIDDADLIAETELTLIAMIFDPGTTYYWRVDEVEADGNVITGDVWSFTTMPLEAHFPVPADGTAGLEPPVTLSWTPGKVVVMHDLYFGTDEAAVASADMSTFKGKLMQASYDPGPLNLFTTYYWRVDEFTPTGTVMGPVWKFSTANYVIIDNGQTTLDYDNTAEPYVSETAFSAPADLTYGGLVSELSLQFKGQPDNLNIDEATGTYEIAGSGADVWGTADQFHYVYRELTGDATIVARVVSNGTGSNTWAKGGVMIRQSIAAGSTHAYMPITGGGGNGASFQGRPTADSASVNSDSGTVVAPPYWVKLERVGNNFSGSISPDGATWTQLGDARETVMTDPVLVGLAVTSHAAGEVRTFTFDNVSIEGSVSGDFLSQDVASTSGNSAEAIYAVLEDSTGASAMVVHPDPAATQIDTWKKWRIPLGEFAGVDATAAAKLSIGVGNGLPGGVGSISITEIRVVEPEPQAQLAAAYAFGSRALDCATYNDPSVNYTMVLHESVQSVQYDPARGFGYEVIYPTDSPFGDRAGYGVFGPFDDSPNNRNEFPDECPEELYDSFIGAKSFTNEVSAATMGDMDTPSPNPEGLIFRVDVPNGFYRFVGAFGEADNGHAHRIIAEDGGSGPPANIGSNYAVLVHNHDQSQYDIGEIAGDEAGDAVFARVGFDGKIPPPGDGVAPSPVFVDMDENGRPTDAGANSPILEVTQGYIRIHQLQGNSNDGPGGSRDANGGDIVILELWKVGP
ncbi:MAG: LamG domain-containing protein [Planctomycetota bacterium]